MAGTRLGAVTVGDRVYLVSQDEDGEVCWADTDGVDKVMVEILPIDPFGR